MTTAGKAPSSPAPGVVRVRLPGPRPELAALARLVASLPGVAILTACGPRPDRRDPGARVYLTIRIDPPSGTEPGHQPGRPATGARSHQP